MSLLSISRVLRKSWNRSFNLLLPKDRDIGRVRIGY